MKRLLTSLVAALAIFTISEAALAGPSGGHGRDGGRHGEGNGTMRGGYGTSRHEYGRDWKNWSKRFYCEEYGCYLYWCEECRWWYRYDERGEKYRPLSEEYRPNHEKK